MAAQLPLAMKNWPGRVRLNIVTLDLTNREVYVVSNSKLKIYSQNIVLLFNGVLSCQLYKNSLAPLAVLLTLSHQAVGYVFQPCDDNLVWVYLTHWGRVTHICIRKLYNHGSDNGLSPGWHQAIIWTNAGILLIGPLGTNFSEILIEIYIFSFTKMHLKLSSGMWRPYCLGLSVFKELGTDKVTSLHSGDPVH